MESIVTEMRKRKEAMQRGCLAVMDLTDGEEAVVAPAVFKIYEKFPHQSACGPLSVRRSKWPMTVSLAC